MIGAKKLLLASTCLTLAAIGSARAQVLTYDPLNTPANPAFATGAATVSNALGQYAISSASFGGSSFIITGDPILLVGSPVVIDVFGAATIGAQLIDGGGNASLAVTGGGVLSLTAYNTYTGGTTVQQGTLAGYAGSFGTGPIAIAAGATLEVDDPSSNATLSNVISGSGAFVSATAGQLYLTGANSYSGGTTVQSGMLIGNASSFGTGTIAIATGATLAVYSGSGSQTFANVLAGTGEFVKYGAGTLDVTGTSTLTGSTLVEGGTLRVDGSLASSPVTLQSGAVLTGAGTVGAVAAQSGSIVAPGPNYTTLTVANNYQQAANSTLQIALTSAGATNNVSVQGAATIAGGAKLDIVKTDAGAWVPNQSYTVLTAAQGVSGVFTLEGVNPTRLSIFYNLMLKYDANNVYFDVAQTTLFKAVAATPNQSAAAQGINSGTVTPLYTTIAYLGSVPAAQAAFDAISGEAYASARTVFMEDSRFVREAFILRLQDAEDSDIPGTTAAAYGDYPAQKGPRSQIAAASGLTAVWAQGFGDWGSNTGAAYVAPVRHNTGGVLGGVDTLLGDLVRVGIGGGYSHTAFSYPGRASAGSSDNLHIGLYAGARLNGFGVKLGAAYSWNNLSMARTVAFSGFSEAETGTGGYSTAQAFGDFSYRYRFGAAAIEPFETIAYVDVNNAPVTETGGSAALHADSNDSATTFNTLGVRGYYSFNLGSMVSTLEGSAGWKHAFGDLAPQQAFNFVGGSVFSVTGAAIGQDALAVKGGVNVAVTPAISLTALYDAQFAKTANDQSVKGAMAYKF